MTGTDQSGESTYRRRFLKGLGALSIVGLAGCGGDGGDTDTPTNTEPSTDSPTATDEPTPGTPVDTDTPTPGTPGETDTPTPGTTPEDTATPTDTPVLPENPDPLLSFANVLTVDAGGSTTISGSFVNPYLFSVTSGEFTITPPSDDWSVTPQSGTTFESLAAQQSGTAEWEITAPSSASGEASLTVNVTYSAGGQEANVSFTQPIYAATPPEVSTSSVSLGDLGPTWKHAMVPQTDGGASDTVAFALPEDGQTLKDANQNPVDSYGGTDDKSADVYLGYDADNFYLKVVATDDQHQSVSGGDMWMGDTVQIASASDDRSTYGPDYGLTRVDGSSDKIQFRSGNAEAGVSAIDLQTSREGTTTTYDATISWTALRSEAPSPGESFPFDILVHERDGGSWIGAISWSDFSIYSPKFPKKEGTLTLESDGEDLPWEAKITSAADASLGERGTWVVTIANYADTSQEITMTLEGTSVEETISISADAAARVTVKKTVVSENVSGLGATLDNGETTRTL